MFVLLKKYYVFLLILTIFSYLVPKDEYKKYIQFFIGIFVVVLFLEPILEFVMLENATQMNEIFESFHLQMESLEFDIEKGENVYEHFFFKGEGE